MKKNIELTIIVPIYKIEEEKLKKCIESLKMQKNDSIEFILIDDGSPDKCGQICDESTINDNRFRILHISNHGVSYARNLGIKNAKGKYLAFVDGDDELMPNAVEVFLENRNYDLVLFNYSVNKKNNKKTKKIFIFKDKIELKKIQASFIGGININELRYTGAPWGKLYKKDIIIENNCFFDEHLPRSQDNEFNFRYMNFAKNCKYVDEIVYDYEVNANSAMRKYWINAIENSDKLLEKIEVDINNTDTYEMFQDPYYNFCYSKIKDIIDTKIFHKEYKKRYVEKIKELKDLCIRHPYCIALKCNNIKLSSYDGALALLLKNKKYILASILIITRKFIKLWRYR